MLSHFLRASPCLILLVSIGQAGCGPGGEVCNFDSSCDTGFRCEEVNKGDRKICVACDPSEVPYDGLDNDCNKASKDFDVDGDGDNAAEATDRPGTDCDDHDALINPMSKELCTDNKDNNCDGRIDEPACADVAIPTVQITQPRSNTLVEGTIEVRVDAQDDTSIMQLILTAGDVTLGTSALDEATFVVDTNRVPDGPTTLIAEATDIAGHTARAELAIIIDNHSPPLVTITTPVVNGSYSGFMDLTATATDAKGLAHISFFVDSSTIAAGASTTSPLVVRINLASLSEGAHSIRTVSRDGDQVSGQLTTPFKVDRTGPGVSITVEPHVGTRVEGTFTVSVAATDASGIALISSSANRFSDMSATSPLVYEVDSFTAPRIPNGDLVITAAAHDQTIVDGVAESGNVTTIQTTVVVNNVPPEPVVIFTPRDGAGVFRETTLSAQVSSPTNTPIDRVEFRVNDRLILNDILPPWETIFDFSDSSGTMTVSARAYDHLGFFSEVISTVIVVPPPSFRIPHEYSPGVTLGTGSYAIGDVTGDGLADVVVAGGAIAVLTGTIAFGEYRLLPARVIAPLAAVAVRLANMDIQPALDIVAVTTTSLDVYTNSGTGIFAIPTRLLHLIPQSTDLEVADLNGDGANDAVVGLGGAGTGDIKVFFNDDGLLAAGQVYGLNGAVTDVVIANADGDPDLDIAVGRSAPATITVYRNNGAGLFGAGQDSFPVSPSRGIAVGDVTGDNYPDIVAAQPATGMAPDQTQILAGNSSTPGTFTVFGSTTNQHGPVQVILRDLTGDGALDAVVAVQGANGVDILTNNNGVFTRTRSFVVARDGIHPRLYDLDGDGDQDLVLSSPTDSRIVVAKGLGGTDFKASPVDIVPRAPTAMSSGDLVGDPGIDLAVAMGPPIAATYGQIRVLERGMGGFVFNTDIDLSSHISTAKVVTIGDVDHLNRGDIVIGSANVPTVLTPDTAQIFLSNNSGGFQPAIPLSAERPISVAVGDVDNDGANEIVVSEDFGPATTHDGSAVFEGSGGAAAYRVAQGFGAVSVAIGDLDHDPLRLIDYAVANNLTADITVNIWNGSGFNTSTFNALPGISALIIGRVGNDDVNDLVSVGTQGVIIMEGDANFNFGSPIAYPAGSSPTSVIGGDFNRDGLFDVLTINSSTDQVSLLIASPEGGFFRPLTIGTGDSPSSFTAGDFDGDGRDDLAIASSGSPGVMVIYSNGDSL